MKLRHHVAARYSDILLQFVKTNTISYKITGSPRSQWIVFDIWSTDDNAKVLLNDLKKVYPFAPTVFVEYTEAERSRAKYLEFRPQKQNIDIINDKAFCYSCEKVVDGDSAWWHYKQTGNISISKEPSVGGKTAFWSESTGFSEIFVDQRIIDIVETHSFQGIEFLNVILRNGKFSKNLFQMTASNVLDSEQLLLGFGEKELSCPVCGKKQYYVDRTYQLHLNKDKLVNNFDLYVTEQIWGDGIPCVKYLVSQRFYKVLKENKLSGSIEFIPVIIDG